MEQTIPCPSKNIAEKNGMWKGDEVGLNSLHEWIKNRFPKPKLCVSCKEKPPYDLANISQEYKRDINDFEWLCRSCHMIKDGRMGNLRPPKRFLMEKECETCNVVFQPKGKTTRFCSGSCRSAVMGKLPKHYSDKSRKIISEHSKIMANQKPRNSKGQFTYA